LKQTQFVGGRVGQFYKLQVDLFVRTSRGMGLTEYGEVLLEQTRIMHRVHENTLVKLGSMKVSRERGFKAGVGFAWWHLFFRELYREYRQAHPEAPAHIDTSNHLRCMDQLISGDIDFFGRSSHFRVKPPPGCCV